MKKPKMITFMGKKYSLADCESPESDTPIYLDCNSHRDKPWSAIMDGGPFGQLDSEDEGLTRTPQAAVAKLERMCLQWFREAAKLCGYELSE